MEPFPREVVLGTVLTFALTLSVAAVDRTYLCPVFVDHKLGVTGTATHRVLSPLVCILYCIDDPECYSVDVCSFDPDGVRLCQKNKGMVRDVTSLTKNSSCTHYRVKHLDPRYEACMSGSCYFFSLATLPTWTKAKEECYSRGGYMIKLDNWDESDLVKDVLEGRYTYYSKKKYAIGAYRTTSTGNFTWLDGTPLEDTIIDWDYKYNQPQNLLRAAYYRQEDVFKWHDIYDNSKTDYICEEPYT